MISASESDERPAFDCLARKTVEMLDIVNSTRQLVINKYNNDQTMWLEAMFRVLMMKNATFVYEEKTSTVRDSSINKILHDIVYSIYNSSSSQNTESSSTEERNVKCQLRETGCTLISCFRVFTNFLVNSQLDVTDELTNLQEITRNIEKYLKMSTDDKEKEKSLAKRNKNDEKVKLCDLRTTNPKIRSHSVEIKQSVEKIASDRKCDICQETITMFNNDEDFSIILHEQEKNHVEAVKKRMAPKLSDQGKNLLERESISDSNIECLNATKKNQIKSLIVEKVGSNQAELLRIDGPQRFYCTVCKCKISSMLSVSSHVEGKSHKKNYSKVENETETQKVTSANVDPEEDQIIRISSSVPVTSLF